MSEVTMYIRQGDAIRASNMVQKRPLSIITENDSDDPDAIDYSKYQDTADGCVKDYASDSKNVSKSAKICINCDISKVSEMAKTSNNTYSVQQNTTSSQSSTVASIAQSTETQLLTPVSSSITSTTTQFSDESGLIENGNDNVITADCCLKQPAETANFSQLVNSEIQNVKVPQNNLSLATIQNDTFTSSDTSKSNILTASRLGGEGYRLARIRETAERLHLTSPLPPNSHMPSSATLSAKFGHRLWPHTSTSRTLQDVKSPVGQKFQQLSINPNGGTPLLISLALSSSPDPDDTTDSSSNKFLSDISDNGISGMSPTNRNSIFSNAKFTSSKLSAYFSRRMSNESTGSLSESDLSDGDVGSDDNPSTYLSYFRRLKETTDKLHLSTRRPSIMLWRQQYLESQGLPMIRSNQNVDFPDERLTSDRKQRIDKALEWLRNQLQEMRSQDQNLARQFLAIRHDIYKLKLQRSTEEHQELIDDFHFELQELQELSDILDLPLPEYADNPLKHIGVTRLNISARRFSAC